MLALLLTAVMVITMLPVTALAAEVDYDNYRYENGKVYLLEGENRTELTEEQANTLNGVSLQGIAGINGRIFPTMVDAYEAISSVLAENGGLEQDGLSDEVFNELYTDKVSEDDAHKGVELTWTIFGNVDIPAELSGYYLSGGRAAAWYGSDAKTIRYIHVTGFGENAQLNVNKNPSMPYQWWGSETTDEYIGVTISNLTLNAKQF